MLATTSWLRTWQTSLQVAEIYRLRPELRGKGYSILVSRPEGEKVHKVAIERAAVLKAKTPLQ